MNHINVWEFIIVILLLLLVLLLIIMCKSHLKHDKKSKEQVTVKLINKHEYSAPIHLGGISTQNMTVSYRLVFETINNEILEFKVNASMFAKHQIGEEGKIIYQGKRLLNFIC